MKPLRRGSEGEVISLKLESDAESGSEGLVQYKVPSLRPKRTPVIGSGPQMAGSGTPPRVASGMKKVAVAEVPAFWTISRRVVEEGGAYKVYGLPSRMRMEPGCQEVLKVSPLTHLTEEPQTLATPFRGRSEMGQGWNLSKSRDSLTRFEMSVEA